MKAKTSRKINIVDIIILVSLLCVIGALVFGVLRDLGTSGEKVTVRYVMEVDPIDSDFTAKVVEGDGVFDYSSSSRIGTVKAVASSQAYYKGHDSKGSTVYSPMEGSSVLHITVEADAVSTKTGYAVGGTVIGMGKTVELRLPNLYCVGECVSVEVLD